MQLQRHGARFPTSAIGTIAQIGLAKIKNVTKFTDSRLNFISSFVYDLGTNDLVKFGATQWVTFTHNDRVDLTAFDRSFDAGEEAFQRYSSLVSASNIPFVRSDSSARVVMSATNWTAGNPCPFPERDPHADWDPRFCVGQQREGLAILERHPVHFGKCVARRCPCRCAY